MTPAKDPKQNNYPKNAKVNQQELIIFEGFRPNGLQIRNQRHLSHIVACVKMRVGALGEMPEFSMTFGDAHMGDADIR